MRTAANEPLDPFSVSISNNPTHTIHFDRGRIYLGNRLLSLLDQRNFLNDYIKAYSIIRRRNYAWRFLSSCHDYFNGQLQEIANFRTNEEKIRYLFCHAEKNIESKTAEALRIILPLFLVLPQQAALTTLEHSVILSEATDDQKKDAPQQSVVMHSSCHDRHLQWVEEIFARLWAFSSVKKTALQTFDARHFKYYLLFSNDCRTAIMESNPGFFARYNPLDNSIECEIAESEWAKKLYHSLDCFRRRVYRSNGIIKEINSAFNEFIKVIHQNPPNLNSVGLMGSDFDETVVSLRLQIVVIHADWIRSLEENASNEVCNI